MTAAVEWLRLLVTGSRNWTDRDALEAELDHHYRRARAAGKALMVVHGDNPAGADRFAREWVEEMQERGFGFVDQEPYPADWSRACDEHCYHRPRFKNGEPYCPVAGNLRNQKMVDLGADACVAFLMPESRGTKDSRPAPKGLASPLIDATPVAYNLDGEAG